jgi:hypothetical protein
MHITHNIVIFLKQKQKEKTKWIDGWINKGFGDDAKIPYSFGHG